MSLISKSAIILANHSSLGSLTEARIELRHVINRLNPSR
jgi:hypothetical protein